MKPNKTTSQNGYVIEEHEWGWIAREDGRSGHIKYVTNSKEPEAFAAESPFTRFSILSKGVKPGGIIPICHADGSPTLMTLLFAAVFMGPEESEDPTDPKGISHIERIMAVAAVHPSNPLEEKFFKSQNNDPRLPPTYEHAHGILEKLAERVIMHVLKTRGSKGGEAITKLLKKIETKVRHLEPDELSFLSAVEKSTEQSDTVPTQKAVFDIWVANRTGRTDKRFKTLCGRLGFKWLPAATRGKNIVH